MELTLALCFCAVFLLVFAISRLLTQTRVTVVERMERMQKIAEPSASRFRQIQGRRRKTRKSGLSRLEARLRQAEIDLSAREFLFRWLLGTGCAAILATLLAGPGGAVLAIVVCCLGVLGYLRLRGNQRTRRFDEGLHGALTMIVNSLRSGHSFVQSIQSVALDTIGPVHDEFERIVAETQVGVELEESLRHAVERVGSEDFDLVVTAIVIQRQVGGNLSEVLEQIADTIRERVRLKREVKALTAQGRLSAVIFMVLPIGVAGILFFMNPPYIETLFENPVGIGMLVMAAVGQLVGYVFIRRIVNVEL